MSVIDDIPSTTASTSQSIHIYDNPLGSSLAFALALADFMPVSISIDLIVWLLRIERLGGELASYRLIMSDIIQRDRGYQFRQSRDEVLLRHYDVRFFRSSHRGQIVLRGEGLGIRSRFGNHLERSCMCAVSSRSALFLAAQQWLGPTYPLIHGGSCPGHGLEHRIRTQGVKVGSCIVEGALFRHRHEVQVRVEVEFPRQSGEDVELRLVIRADAQV